MAQVYHNFIQRGEIQYHPIVLGEVHRDTTLDRCNICKKFPGMEAITRIFKCKSFHFQDENEGTVSVYECTKCDYFVHRGCTEFQDRFKYDKTHPFVVCKIDDDDATTICLYCSKIISKDDVVYGCRGCKYFLHRSCVDSLFDKVQLQVRDDKEIEHFLHEHPLVLREVLPDDRLDCPIPGGHPLCEICTLKVEDWDWAYHCLICQKQMNIPVYMHKACAEIPLKPIQHPFHPQHLLFPKNTYECCQACRRLSFSYIALCCLSSGFFIHTTCCTSKTQELPVLKFQHKGHPFFLVENRFDPSNFSTCSTCGGDHYSDDVIFKCMYPNCGDNFHVHCAPFDVPKTVKCYKQKHWDPLTLADPFAPEGPNEIHYCDICENERDITRRVYRCIEPGCNSNFTSHISCALSEVLPSLVAEWESTRQCGGASYEITVISSKTHPLQRMEKVASASLNWATEEFNKAWGVYTKYLASLTLSITEHRPEQFACLSKLQIHLWPQYIRHLLHSPEPLSIFPVDVQERPDSRCSWCGMPGCKNLYSCHQCKKDGFNNFQLCETCASCVVPSVNLRLPDHLLFPIASNKSLSKLCHECGEFVGGVDHSNLSAFVCVLPHTCVYALHLHCLPFPLPEKIKHKNHPDHDLVYTVISGDFDKYSLEKYYCDDFECKKERNPNYPFYYCRECNFSAHTACCISEVLPLLIEDFELQLPSEVRFPLDAIPHHITEKLEHCRLQKEKRVEWLQGIQKELMALELPQLEPSKLPTRSSLSTFD